MRRPNWFLGLSAVAGSFVGLALWILAAYVGWGFVSMPTAQGAGAAMGVVVGGLYQNRKAIRGTSN
ncbi:UNVERIFIED_ORG: hypothetical protein M2438_002501 [Methylobacterium sp. SuP10 SLI 274]|uniref:hypothetical protein n=1 Tax=Methylorubrum extorquens TaxID=408 RepID=UPI001AE36DA2|nr:hypothetical protein [Methylorubrum extorquens]MDF9863725.1 hypothetical protein [Methylorubrum pseudosasae]MDH6637326.1 hypothetical protein [Methylobacterium sp. SuP10 SLI 274]MDH6666506.1 hypothetical protein [Methylorubrum zatmanii]MCP1558417.1 hypothetical protein [Methylorubrum extorquens]MDF9792036.1 hypothetical protein [Methylorubrum extorquens]